MTALAGLQREVLIRQYDIEFAFVAGYAVCHGLRIGEFHGMRHMHVVHEIGGIGVLGFFCRRQGVTCMNFSIPFRIVHQDLPVFMATVAVVEVTDFTGVKIAGTGVDGIIVHISKDVAVLVIRSGVAVLTTGRVGGRIRK